MNDWIRSHVIDVPNEVVDFCGDLLRDSTLLNVGCGEMLTDLGLLSLGPKKIIGLDVTPKAPNWLEEVANKVHMAGIDFCGDFKERLEFVQYDGLQFPFEDRSFNVIISWSAFEHVRDVGQVLREMRRVLADDGHAFVQVYPWYLSRQGSHLTDYISEPFFQSIRPLHWVKEQLQAYVADNPEENEEFILNYMLSEYTHLNELSPSQFYREAVAAGFAVKKARLIAYDEDLSQVAKDVDFSDLMIGGTKMLLRPK